MYKVIEEDFEAVLNNGKDVDMTRLSSCSTPSLDWCEANCADYYGCETVAFANDILAAYENR